MMIKAGDVVLYDPNESVWMFFDLVDGFHPCLIVYENGECEFSMHGHNCDVELNDHNWTLLFNAKRLK